MRLPRNAKIFRGQLEAAPWASLFFLLLSFFLLKSAFFPPSGVRIDLPESQYVEGTTNATVVLMIDWNGDLYFENQLINEPSLARALTNQVSKSREPLTLVVHSDRAVPLNYLFEIRDMARQAGIGEVMVAARPAFARETSP